MQRSRRRHRTLVAYTNWKKPMRSTGYPIPIRRARARRLMVVLSASALPAATFAQSAPPAAPATSSASATGVPVPGLGGARVTTSVRSRGESWRWFDGGNAGDYVFGATVPRIAIFLEHPRLAWRVEGVTPSFLGLPSDAVAAAPLGQLGLGGNYTAANNNRTSLTSVVLRQAWVEWRPAGAALRAGRFEFSDGAERAAKTPAMTALKATRVSQRLIGPFGFSHVGRSTDGVSVRASRGSLGALALLARPTSGVFNAREAGRTLDIDLSYGALTSGGAVGTLGEVDLRLFGATYRDRRGVVATDSRPSGARQLDSREVDVSTTGAHAVLVVQAGSALADALAWGAVQRGSWGALRHHASALAIEGGVQWPKGRWAPWLRAGGYRASGDRTPGDERHETFFQLLPTPRLYARFPFYNGMNSEELFAQLTFKPTKQLVGRVGVNALRLAEPGDLWYAGGGAFDDRSFGYAGRPSNGERNLGRVADGSIEWKPRRWLSVEGYLAMNWGNAVAGRTYATSGRGRFGMLEVTLTR